MKSLMKTVTLKTIVIKPLHSGPARADAGPNARLERGAQCKT